MIDLPLDHGESITASYRQAPVALVPYVLVAAARSLGAGLAAGLNLTVANPILATAFNAASSWLTGLVLVVLRAGFLTYRRTISL